MSRILRPWTSQPQSPTQVNSDLGFVGLVLPGQSRFDLVTGQELAAVGGTPTQVVGPYGPALLTDANQEYISAAATPAQRLTAEGSIVWVGELFAGFSSDSSLGGISHNSSNNPPYVTLELKRRGLFVYLSYSFNGGASFGETQLNVGSYTGPAIIVGTYRAGEQRAFMRTPTEVFAAGTIAAGSMGSSATSLWSVGERLNARNPQASCALLGVADRCWSEAQALAVLGSPWAEAFRPRSIWVPVSAGGGGTISVPAGSLVLTGYAPTVIATANQTIAVPAGSLSLSAFAPTVVSAVRVQVPAGALSLTGYAPTVVATANNRIAVPVGSLTLTGYAPTVAAGATQTISVPAGSLTLTAYAPTVTATQNNFISVPAGALSLVGYAPNVTGAARIVSVPSGALTLTGYAPTISNGAESFTSSAVFYIPLRMVSGLWSTSGVTASISADKQAWLPPIRQPISYVDQRDGRVYCDPAWYRAFEFIFETRLGGRLGPSIPDVVSTVTATQATAAAASATVAEVAQQTQANAEALFVVREVVQGGGLDGAEQIPGVDLR